ncbi:hypothetical protein Tco_0607956 [Tanacetum coccineum]
MANLLEDIQCAGSDTRPHMLDRTDFASWQQRIRLYYRGKENVVNILKSIDEGAFQMGTYRETLTEGTEEDKERYNADMCGQLEHLLQGLPKYLLSYQSSLPMQRKTWDNVKMPSRRSNNKGTVNQQLLLDWNTSVRLREKPFTTTMSGMNWLTKKKFVIVCHEKVVRMPLEGDEILWIHGERTQGVVKTLMNTKVGELKLSDISVIRDFIDVLPEDLSMTTATIS